MECRKSGGFTLIELLVAISISGVLMLLATPSFLDLIRNNRLVSQTSNFIAAVNFARAEAINRNTRITLCINRGGGCDSGLHWEQGLIVFVDKNGNLEAEQHEHVRLFAPLAMVYTLRPNLNVNRLEYYADGSVRKTNGAWPMMTFRLCAPDAVDGNLSQRSREIRINATGRMRLQFGREIPAGC